MKVLVAEGADELRAELGALLRGSGHDVVTIDNGPDALGALLQADGPRLAFLGEQLPGLGGLEVCRRVRASMHVIRPHLVSVTARRDGVSEAEGLQAGFDDFLAMPVVSAELTARLSVGERAIGVQRDLLARTRALEVALARIDAVSALAARVQLSAAPVSEDLVDVCWRKFDSLRPGVEVRSGSTVSRVHGALALPSEQRWIDLVLEVTGTPTTSAGGSSPRELLADLMTTLLRRTAAALEAGGRPTLVPVIGHEIAPGPMTAGTQRTEGPWTLWVHLHALEPQTVRYDALTPGVVLLSPLKPASLADLEVLRPGTWLTPALLERTRTFFNGSDASTSVAVGSPSPLARSVA